MKIITSVTNWISTNAFYNNAFGNIVAIADFSPMEHLDQSGVSPQKIPALELALA